MINTKQLFKKSEHFPSKLEKQYNSVNNKNLEKKNSECVIWTKKTIFPSFIALFVAVWLILETGQTWISKQSSVDVSYPCEEHQM